MMMISRKLKRKGIFRKKYQLWETVSEGSPITPWFRNLNDLIEYQLKNDTSITRDMSREDWLAFFEGEFGLIDIRTGRFIKK